MATTIESSKNIFTRSLAENNSPRKITHLLIQEYRGELIFPILMTAAFINITSCYGKN